MRAATPEAHKLFHDGAKALAAVEAAGMRVDRRYLKRTITKTNKRINRIEQRMRSDDVYKVWRREYGSRLELGSRDQLGHVLFDCMGYEHPGGISKTGKVRMNEEALANVDNDFVQKGFLPLEKLKKARNTYLAGIEREVEGEFLHAVYNLHTTTTYRSSSSDPNFQNIPIRDPMIGKLIRQCFIARPGHVLVEIDYGALEVRIAACYHHDPTMVKYIRDGYDLHRDMAAQCFKLPRDKVPKDARQHAKGAFVFAEFYGDYFKGVAPNLWSLIGRHDLQTVEGVDLYTHLASNGVERLGACRHGERAEPGTYERHIQRVEDHFWNKRFPVYTKWKQDWWNAYLRTGGFHTKTGFSVEGIYTRNQVINSPIQGSAFHCLLWSLIRMVAAIRKNKMRSRVVGQIHDSIVLDVHLDELADILAMAKHILTVALPKAWPWITVPLDADAEVAPKGGTWYDKEEVSWN
jgi:DNA polymerase-1